MMQAIIPSPLGHILLQEEQDAIIRLTFLPKSDLLAPVSPLLKEVSKQLQAYFEGRLTAFSLPLRPMGSSFQLQVWKGLETIPYGQTLSYAQLAQRIGKPGACRAVGGANSKNPLPILIPCHRVIAADGSLGGYSAGNGIDGKAIKQKLLALEGIIARS